MKFICNRFAIVPHKCYRCKKYVWLEGYRHDHVWEEQCSPHWISVNICNNCINRYIPQIKLTERMYYEESSCRRSEKAAR